MGGREVRYLIKLREGKNSIKRVKGSDRWKVSKNRERFAIMYLFTKFQNFL